MGRSQIDSLAVRVAENLFVSIIASYEKRQYLCAAFRNLWQDKVACEYCDNY